MVINSTSSQTDWHLDYRHDRRNSAEALYVSKMSFNYFNKELTPNRLHWILLPPGTFALTASALGAVPAGNTLDIVIGNGPHAGTYKMPADTVICLHVKKQNRYSAAWKNFDAHDAKAIAEAGISISNPDGAEAKQGAVRVAFGDPGKKPTVYNIDQAPLTMTKDGRGAEITFQGETKDGIQLRVTAKCSDVEEM